MRSTYLPILFLPALALLACGCTAGGKTGGRPPAWSNAPTQPMVEVVAAINRNNLAVPTLWASHGYKATVVDDNKRTHTFTGSGVLLYRHPREMQLVGNKEFVGTIFEVGSTNDRFWLKLVPEIETMWWGHYRHVGKPCAEPIPIRPDLVAEVLGVAVMDTDFTKPPAPVMRYNHERDAYMFVWVTPLPDRWAALKEIWYDRKTKLPTLVMLYDPNGRVVMRAELNNHRPVEVNDLPRDRWPLVASEFLMYFPETGTRMELDLREMMLDKRGVPARRGINFPNLARTASQLRVVQIDEGCEGE